MRTELLDTKGVGSVRKTAVVIACGGMSKRFGTDKTVEVLGGETLLDRAVRLAERYNGLLALAIREKQGRVPDKAVKLVDHEPELGPISALRSGFEFAEREFCTHVLLLACDQPFLPPDLATRLHTEIGSAGAALPRSGGHDQPMAALWRCDQNALKNYLASGERSLWRFAETVGATRVDWDDNDGSSFSDIDNRDHLEAARERIERM